MTLRQFPRQNFGHSSWSKRVISHSKKSLEGLVMRLEATLGPAIPGLV